MNTEEYIIFSTPAPAEMVDTFKTLHALRRGVEVLGSALSPHSRGIRLNYANKAMEYLLAKYQYDALDDPELVDKIKYSHNIELKGETLNFIRVGKKDPGILEIMKANNNLNINP